MFSCHAQHCHSPAHDSPRCQHRPLRHHPAGPPQTGPASTVGRAVEPDPVTLATLARDCGLSVNASRGINCINIGQIRDLPHLHELNIGHSIISRTIFTGIDEAVREIKTRMNRG